MTVLDPGHCYELTNYDEALYHGPLVDNVIQFMKRDKESHPDGEYPGNEGHYSGTNCQEVLRALIDRVKYLDNQIPDDDNVAILFGLRVALYSFEHRAKARRGENLSPSDLPFDIETVPACKSCGHILCSKHEQH